MNQWTTLVNSSYEIVRTICKTLWWRKRMQTILPFKSDEYMCLKIEKRAIQNLKRHKSMIQKKNPRKERRTSQNKKDSPAHQKGLYILQLTMMRFSWEQALCYLLSWKMQEIRPWHCYQMWLAQSGQWHSMAVTLQ